MPFRNDAWTNFSSITQPLPGVVDTRQAQISGKSRRQRTKRRGASKLQRLPDAFVQTRGPVDSPSKIAGDTMTVAVPPPPPPPPPIGHGGGSGRSTALGMGTDRPSTRGSDRSPAPSRAPTRGSDRSPAPCRAPTFGSDRSPAPSRAPTRGSDRSPIPSRAPTRGTNSDRAGSALSVSRCSRRSCLCGAPPPLSGSPMQLSGETINARGHRCSVVLTSDMATLDDPEESCGEEEDTDVVSQDPGFGNQGRRSTIAGRRPSIFGRSSEDFGLRSQAQEDPEDKPDYGNCWLSEPRRKFRNHPKTSVVDRIGRVDARRRNQWHAARMQKQKDLKRKRFDAMPWHEAQEIADAFAKFDYDMSGELNKEEVVHCLKEFGLMGMDREETKAIIEICSDASADDQFAFMRTPLQDRAVAVELPDFALTVVPRVRRKLQEMRSEGFHRTFTLMFDTEQTGRISFENCKDFCKELGVDVSTFFDCYAAEESNQQLPDEMYFDTLQKVVSQARERTNRTARAKERSIQADTGLDEDIFQEFREDILTLRELFLRFDGDGNGFLDFQEAMHLLKDFGLWPTCPWERSEVLRIMEACDEDKSEQFRFAEFLRLVRQVRIFYLKSNQEDYQRTFDHYDRDGSGELTVAELSSLLCALDLVPQTRREQEELAHLIHLSDSDGSGLIDFKEFQVLCQRVHERMKRLRYEQQIVEAIQRGFSAEEMHDLRFVFDRLDTSFNGFIDKQEARVGLKMAQISVSLEAFEDTFRTIDVDRSGELDFSEFTELMRLLRDREGCFNVKPEE